MNKPFFTVFDDSDAMKEFAWNLSEDGVSVSSDVFKTTAQNCLGLDPLNHLVFSTYADCLKETDRIVHQDKFKYLASSE